MTQLDKQKHTVDRLFNTVIILTSDHFLKTVSLVMIAIFNLPCHFITVRLVKSTSLRHLIKGKTYLNHRAWKF